MLPPEALDGRWMCDCKGLWHDGDNCAHVIGVLDQNDTMVPPLDSLLTKLPEVKNRGRKKRTQKVPTATDPPMHCPGRMTPLNIAALLCNIAVMHCSIAVFHRTDRRG